MTEGPDRLARQVVTGIIAYTFVYAAVIVAMPVDLAQRALIADAAFFPFHPVAAFLLWRAAQRDASRGPRWLGLTSLAWSQALGVLNTLVWVLSSGGVLPLNSIYFQYLGILITILSVIGVAMLVPRRPAIESTVALPWLDIALFGLAALAIGWFFVGWPLVSSGSESGADFAWFALITSADAFCVLLALAAWTYPSPRIGRAGAVLLAAAYAATVWADIVIENATVAGTYRSGGWSDIAFAATITLVALAGYRETLPPGIPRPSGVRAVLTMRALVPLVATAAVFTPVVIAIASRVGVRGLVVPVAIALTFVLVLQVRYVLLDREIERTVTTRLVLEHELALARQFESLGRYAGAVAHDFSNILSVLLANTHLVGLEAGDRPEVRRSLTLMEESITRGATLGRRLLLLTRGQEMPPVRTDLAGVVRSVSTSLRDVMPDRVRLDEQLPAREVFVLLKPGSGDQLLLNLLVNARDAMPDGGRLSVRLWVDAQAAVLEVEDEGTGIPDEIRARIFEPLFTTKREQQGTGLGLSTVQTVVDQAGGSVAVWSEVGRGTRFTARFPLAPD